MSSVVQTLPVALAGVAANAASNVAWFAPLLIAALAYFHYELMDPESRPIDMENELLSSEYDFIIVGGGTAGTYSPFLTHVLLYFFFVINLYIRFILRFCNSESIIRNGELDDFIIRSGRR